MHILIPAGGRGVRLRPLTALCPKPLLPLGDRPILSRIVESIPSQFPVRILVSATLEASFREWQRTIPREDMELYVEAPVEGSPAGPVRALADCVHDLGIDDDVMVMMGDSILPFDLEDFCAGASPDTLRIATYRLHSLDEARRFGVVEWSGGRVTGFEEKPQRPRSPWVFVGSARIPRRLVAQIGAAADRCPPQMGELVARFLEMGEPVEVYPVTREWHDIGTFASYLEAHRPFLTPAQQMSLQELGNDLGGVVYVHPTARVSGSTLRNCIVHEGAVVENASLRDCVVHPCVSVVDRAVHGMLVGREVELSFA